MAGCYIIFSKKLNQYYVGATDKHAATRIAEHNAGHYGPGHFTSKTDDWTLFYFLECESMIQALRIEKHIKRMKSRKFYHDLKKYSDLQGRLLSKYR